jgi:hypothetical protein
LAEKGFEMYLTKQEAYDVLQAEIVWCLDNPDKELNHDQQTGFMNGLRQAQLLLEKAEQKKISGLKTVADFFL